MSKYSKQQECWEEFLEVWPLSRVQSLTIEEYTNLNNKETFTYWLEQRTKICGGIGGGSSFKFGIFRKTNTEKPHSNINYLNDDLYAWHSKYGNTSDIAFSAIKTMIISIIEKAKVGDIYDIDSIDLPTVFKRKIAFLYQSQTNPCLINVFEQGAIDCYFGSEVALSDVKKRFGDKLNENSIFSLAEEVWAKWVSIKGLGIWKLSHGKKDIVSEDSDWLNQYHYVSVHKNTGKSQNKNFINELKIGDVILLTRSGDVLGLVKISSAIVDDKPSPLGDDWMLRKYEKIYWLQSPVKFIHSPKKGWYPTYNSTFMRVMPTDFPHFEAEILTPFFDISFDDLLTPYRQVDMTKLISNVHSENIIMFGPPGTGKTYNTINRALKLFDISEDHFDNRKDFVNKFRDYLITDLEKHKDKPEKRIIFTTFHQSYGYEDFVEGIKVKVNEKDNSLTYPVEAGVFKALCDKAREDEGQLYIIIIDEINRGNISKVFGELITLIEPDKREGEPEALTVMLPYSKTEFSVPANVHIIGTMNTADTSIAKLDIALRRRFKFTEMPPEPSLLTDNKKMTGRDVVVGGVNLKEMLTSINQRIELLYDRDHTIGHSFFMKLTNGSPISDLAAIFEKEIIPLLQEYFFDDWEQIHWVLDAYKTNDAFWFVRKKKNATDVMGKRWKSATNQSALADVWELNIDDNHELTQNPEAYIGIYEEYEKDENEYKSSQVAAE